MHRNRNGHLRVRQRHLRLRSDLLHFFHSMLLHNDQYLYQYDQQPGRRLRPLLAPISDPRECHCGGQSNQSTFSISS
jgi:hypothetical protein